MLPQIWFKIRFPEVSKKHGEAIEIYMVKGVIIPRTINEEFLAEALGHCGNPEAPTVYVTREQCFYRYNQQEGIYVEVSENQILTDLSSLLNECAKRCHRPGFCDTTSLHFQLSKAGQLNGVIRKAKGLLNVSEDYFDSTIESLIACKNGMLRLSDMQLLPFSADFRRRNKLSISYDPSAQCPQFLDTLMRQSLEDDDVMFLQEWCGLALLGKNMPQIIVILVGTAGGGKSTFVKVITEIIGKKNVHTLRTERLGEKFETSFYLGKTLLQGVDVAPDFLTQKSASVLKALTGGDIMNVELKNVRNGGPEIEGCFNIIIICNSLPNIRLEGDSEAWKRRLVLVEYRKPKPQVIITSLADNILKEEGSGVFNWALIGLKRLRDRGWRISRTVNQEKLVNKVLLQSDSPRQFVKRCLIYENDRSITQEDCFQHYVAFCKENDWCPMGSSKANPKIEEEIMREFGLTRRNDIVGANGTAQRGWKGISCKQSGGR